MKTKKGFGLRTIGDEYVIVRNAENVDFSRIISFNESAAYLWKEVEGREFTPGDLAGLLLSRYKINEETARKDATSLIEEWLKAGIIEK